MQTRAILSQGGLPLIETWKKLAWGDQSQQPLKRPAAPTRMISVIIPAYNEERYLGRTLASLHRQNYGWFEIIVVANGCTDGTAKIARGRCHRLIISSQRNLGVARNLGARMAKGELLLFLDADTQLEPMSLRRIAEDFSREDATGTLRGRPDLNLPKFRFVYWLKNLVHAWRLHPGSSGVILCWKDHFFQTGGFDEGLEVRENSELMRRLLRRGNYRYFADIAATTSMRRYLHEGVTRMTWLWLKVWAQSMFGDLHRRHYATIR